MEQRKRVRKNFQRKEQNENISFLACTSSLGASNNINANTAI